MNATGPNPSPNEPKLGTSGCLKAQLMPSALGCCRLEVRRGMLCVSDSQAGSAGQAPRSSFVSHRAPIHLVLLTRFGHMAEPYRRLRHAYKSNCDSKDALPNQVFAPRAAKVSRSSLKATQRRYSLTVSHSAFHPSLPSPTLPSFPFSQHDQASYCRTRSPS